MPRIGLVSISDEREDVHNKITPLIKQHAKVLAEILREIPDMELIVEFEPVNSPEKARSCGRRLASECVQATVFSLPTFAFPRLGILITLFAPGPYLLAARSDPSLPSPAGILGLGGAMKQLGIIHERLWTDIGSPEAKADIYRFVTAASAKACLRGQVMGLIGGRSMGLYPMVSSGTELMDRFGVDVDHVDQSEIIRLADEVTDEKTRKAFEWINANSRGILYDDHILTVSKLEYQIKCYEALKIIAKTHEYDFIAAKCHYEMSKYHVPLCLSTMLLNDPYDWDGPKEPIVCSCEADQDGALTMQILKLLSRKPVCLLDFRYYDSDNDCYLLQNCGSAPSWFAAHSDNPAVNMKEVFLCPCIPKFAGGGAHICFTFKKGVYTMARLYRETDGYHMAIALGEVIDDERIPSGEENWPKAKMKMRVPPDEAISRLNCVHLHAVSGDYVKHLVLLCKFTNTKPEMLTA